MASKFNIHTAFILSCPTVYCSTIRTLLPSGQLKKNVLCCFENEGNSFVRSILYFKRILHSYNISYFTGHVGHNCPATSKQRVFKSLSSEESSPVKYLELEVFLYYLRFCCFLPCLNPPGMLRHPLYYAPQTHGRFLNLLH